MSMTELTVRKTKKGWTVRDRNGNSADGYTRQAAINNYHLLYTIDRNPMDYNFNLDEVWEDVHLEIPEH